MTQKRRDANRRGRQSPKPNLWILITFSLLLALLVVGVNTGYLSAWWNSNLSLVYPNFPFSKVNKVIKLLQLGFGLLAVFELVAFPVFMKDARGTFVWASSMYRLFSGITYRPFRVVRESLEDYLETPGQDRETAQIVIDNIANEVREEIRVSESSPIAAVLQWLSERNVSPEALKRLTFGGFLVLTIADIFTS